MDEDEDGFGVGFVAPIDEIEFEFVVLSDAMRGWLRCVIEADSGAYGGSNGGVKRFDGGHVDRLNLRQPVKIGINHYRRMSFITERARNND